MNDLEVQIGSFIEHGYLNLGSVVDKTTCTSLLKDIRAEQLLSPEIFLSETEFDQNPVYKGVNPVPGRNILEHFQNKLDNIESCDVVVSTLSRVLGDQYEILNKKVICGVPETWIPDWVLERIRDNPVNNLGAYIKPEFRNITYFYGIDFHQDIIDWPGRELDFITLYVYLHEVDEQDAPLQVLSDSHRLGVDQFPHDLKIIDEESNRWHFKSAVTDDEINCRNLTITGEAGNVGLWHSCTLHGTQPNKNDTERLSLRYLIRKLPDSKGAALDEINKRLEGGLFSEAMRQDLNKEGKAQLKKNYLYRKQQEKIEEPS